MHVFLTHCNEWPHQEKWLSLISWLPPSIQQDILAYKMKEDAVRAYLGKCLVKYGFEQMGIHFSWQNVQFSEKDRPFLADSDMDFNISHSGEYVVVVIGRGKVGVDVEQHRKINLDLFDRQFNNREWEFIRKSYHPLQQFFNFWAIKEAAIKADGRGVAVLSKTAIVSEDTVLVEDTAWYYQPLKMSEEYSAAVVGQATISSNDIQLYQVDCEQFFMR